MLLAGQLPRQCRGLSRLPTKMLSRALCCLCLRGAASLCSSRSMRASSRAPMSVRQSYYQLLTLSISNPGCFLALCSTTRARSRTSHLSYVYFKKSSGLCMHCKYLLYLFIQLILYYANSTSEYAWQIFVSYWGCLFSSVDIQQLETHVKNKKQHEQEARDPMIGQLQQMIDTFQNSTDQLATTITASVRSEVQHQLHMTVGK